MERRAISPLTRGERRDAKRYSARKMTVRGRSFVTAYTNAIIKRANDTTKSPNN